MVINDPEPRRGLSQKRHITIPAPAALGGAFPDRHDRIKFRAFVDRRATEAAEARDQFLKIGRRAAGLK
jgi:hypothetical protein